MLTPQAPSGLDEQTTADAAACAKATPAAPLRVLLVARHARRRRALLARLRLHYDVILALDVDEVLSRISRGRGFDMIVCGLSRGQTARLRRELRKFAPEYLPRVVAATEDGVEPLEPGRLSIVVSDATVISLRGLERILRG
jgi:hypothetical protein